MNSSPPDSAGTLPSGSSTRWKWGVCLLLLAASTLNYMDRMALNQSAADIKIYFNLDDYQYSLLESRFVLAFAVGALFFGWLIDRVGVYLIYPFVVTMWSLSGFLTGFAPTFEILLLCRFSLGLFESGNWPGGVVTTKRVFAPEQRTLANGFFQGGTALGAIITPLIIIACLNVFAPQRVQKEAMLHLAGSPVGGLLPASSSSWSAPFQAIGLLGLIWVCFWFLVIRRASLALPALKPTEIAVSEIPWWQEIFCNRRYWLLLLMVLSVNTTWHSFRTWSPLYLEYQRHFTRQSMNAFSSLYYIAAEVGSLTVGFATIRLVRSGRSVHISRLIVFFFCSLLVFSSVALRAIPDGLLFEAVYLLIGFGALGLFPTYFSLSQEVSVKHQGKVTGSLGCLNGLFLAVLYPIVGERIKQSHSYDDGLMLAGVPPLIAFVAVWLFWNPREKANLPEQKSGDQ